MKVILEAGNIPEYSTVTKITGHIEYVLTRSIHFYPAKGLANNKKTVTANDGCVFLSGSGGSISTYPPKTLLAWVVSEDELHDYLHSLTEEEL